MTLEEQIAESMAPAISRIVERVTPALEAAMTKAEPVVRRIVVEDVMPRVMSFGAIAIIGGITVGALVGSWVAVSRMRRGR